MAEWFYIEKCGKIKREKKKQADSTDEKLLEKKFN